MLEEMITSNIDFPNQEIKYQQNMEEMKQLIPYLKEELKTSPTENLVFTLIEIVDFYSLKRYFKLKSNSDSSNESNISKFKESFLANISCLDSFIVIPRKNSFALDTIKNKGNEFKSPNVYNIEGDEVTIDIGGEETFLFMYDNMDDLNSFLENNKNSEKKIFILGVNPNFFEQKKILKKNGFLNKNNFKFYFINTENSKCELKMNNLPRILLINGDNIISEDKIIKDNHFEIEKILEKVQKDKNIKNDENRKKDSNFILLDNDNKRKVIKAINIYANEIGLKGVHFYIKSKISIDRKGITKTRCYPIFYGDANKEGKDLIDALIRSLEGQELFHDIQNKVNII
jgi:hypothetical protein